MIGLLVALPAAGLALAAVLCRWPPRAVTGRIPLFVLLCAGAAWGLSAVILGLALVQPGREMVLSPPGWSGSMLALGLNVDGLAAFCLFLVCGIAALSSLRLLDGFSDPMDLAGPLAVAAATALFVTATRVPLGLVLAWLLLDLALAIAAGGGSRALLTGQAGLLCVLMGVLALPAGALTLDQDLATADAARLQLWLLLAAAVRMGMYPLWWAIPRTAERTPWTGALVRLAPMVAGAGLFLRATQGSRPGESLLPGTLLPLAIVMLLGAMLAWLARDAVEVLDWRFVTQGALILLAIRPPGPVYQSIGLVLLVNLVLCGLILYGTADVPRTRNVQIVRRVADAALIGVPLTLGFQGRWLLYRELVEPVPWVLLLIVIATALASRPRALGGRPLLPALGDHRLAIGVAGLAAGLVLLLGIRPDLLAPILVSITVTESPRAVLDLKATLLAPETMVRGLWLLAAILAPLLAGVLLRRVPTPRDPAILSQRLSARRALRMTGVMDAFASMVLRSGEAVQVASGLVEGRRARVWTLLAVVVVAVVALDPPAVDGTPTALTLAGLTALLAAAAIGAVLLLAGAPRMTVGSLAAGYFLVAAVQGAGGHWAVAIMTLVAGAVIVAILAVAVVQAPIDRYVARAASRLRSVRVGKVEEGNRPMLGLALAAAVLIAMGIQSVSFPLLVPDSVLRPALILTAGGVLAAVTARSALRLVTGVLLALAGFQLAYSFLDPGMLIAAGLAVFQLLFAVLVSYYLGLSVDGEGAPR
jgi:hypothetical protein